MATTTPMRSLVHLFLDRVEHCLDQPALRYRRDGRLVTHTWQELAAAAQQVAAGLIADGVRPGDRVAQLAENRYEWIVVDLGIQLAQAIHVPIHAPLAAAQVLYQIQHSGARAVFVSNAEQQSKLLAVGSELPRDLLVVAFDPVATDDPAQVDATESLAAGPQPLPNWQSWDTWCARATAATGAALATAARQALTPDHIATILYTSGTTGQPKGVVLTQQNLVVNASETQTAFGMHDDEVRLCFLPLSHIFARTCDLYTWIGLGYELCLATARDSVLDDCQWARPTILSGVPYFFDRVQRILRDEGTADQPGRLRELLGGRIRYCCSGGAALADHTFDFFQRQEVPILQGYGLTETSPVVTCSSPHAVRRGASGRALASVEIKIAADGEILTRGRHVMQGYWQDPAATAEVIRDGWFHTGDYGHVDAAGYLFITGRKKELIVTSAGKNIAPVYLESLLTEDPLIDQAMIIGDGRNYLTALIVPNWPAIQAALPDLNLSCREAACEQPEIGELLGEQIQQRLADVSYHEQVRRFALLPRPFSIEAHELTPKLSLRRPIILDHFRELIEDLYAQPHD